MMEKRKHVRVSLETEIWLGQDGIFTRTTERLRDLSEGGAFIASREVFAVGSVLSLRFKLPGARESPVRFAYETCAAGEAWESSSWMFLPRTEAGSSWS